MAQTTQLDNLKFDSIDFPYNRILAELSPVPRIVSGYNTYVTFGGKLTKRYGTNRESNTGLTGNRRIDRCIIYRTIENPAKIYLIASAYNPSSGFWEVWANRLSGGSPGWSNISSGNLRYSNQSTRAHEFAISRGVCYIKGYPNGASGEKLGTVLYDGSGTPKFTIWGHMPPSTAAGTTSPAGWSASAHTLNVRYGWSYVYCYETLTGHVTSHSPLQTNPDLNPSNTGAFTSKVPQIQVTGLADTTNVPYIRLFRTTDGGGTFYEVKRFANTGAGTITVSDDQGPTSSGTDPVSDVALVDPNKIAPSTVSNNPPPSVVAPKVVGTDTPDPSTPMVTYAGRIWYAIGNTVVFSAVEEIVEGIPEESFPSGVAGNFFRFPFPVLNLIPTSLALIVITTEAIYQIPGSNKETFSPKPLFGNIGGAENAPRAAIPMGDNGVWLTNDYRIAVTRGGNLDILSAPLSTDIYDAIIAGGTTDPQITYWAKDEKDFLLVAVWNFTDPSLSKVWVYDVAKSAFLRLDFWNTPWKIQASGMISGRIKESDNQRRLTFCMYNTGAGSQLAVWDSSGATATDDQAIDVFPVTYGFQADTYMADLPPGNHVNTLATPGKFPVAEALVIERTRFSNDSDPHVFAYYDDFWTQPQMLGRPELAARRDDSKGYSTLVYNMNQIMQRVAFRFFKGANNERFELQSFFIKFNPTAGE